ncbi:MAG TPA: hypothetical protein PKM20_00925 [Nitrosomonas sp.]|uniref:hypothetical protein n=1 Tax=Nitrosomonas sp. TaxID=42353 RepID=UPI000E88C428|nr:hypothetical protein [Nitrosomonas sp.]GJL75274.1 MAG: hypothetical protein NMNS02_13800 [Nitrosomonas sp.]HBV20614.1 hypothetical protein [Nitrosomonas sp.]HNP25278.1 hypothetical protein [Nitrosomonas sp.]
MEDAEIALMFSLLMIPVIIWLQVWVKNRRENRRNELGDEEFETTGRAFFSIIVEGTAVVGGLIMIIVTSGVVVKYIINFYT